MVKTEIALFVKRTNIELTYIQHKLNLLEAMAEDDTLEDCVNIGLDVIFSIENDYKKAATLANSAWVKLHNAKAGNEVEADG